MGTTQSPFASGPGVGLPDDEARTPALPALESDSRPRALAAAATGVVEPSPGSFFVAAAAAAAAAFFVAAAALALARFAAEDLTLADPMARGGGSEAETGVGGELAADVEEDAEEAEEEANEKAALALALALAVAFMV